MKSGSDRIDNSNGSGVVAMAVKLEDEAEAVEEEADGV